MISVLIADDSMIFRRLMREALMRIDGCEIVGEASNGRLALEKITGLQPDLVTLDLEMPVLGGMDVLTQFKDGAPDACCGRDQCPYPARQRNHD